MSEEMTEKVDRIKEVLGGVTEKIDAKLRSEDSWTEESRQLHREEMADIKRHRLALEGIASKTLEQAKNGAPSSSCGCHEERNEAALREIERLHSLDIAPDFIVNRLTSLLAGNITTDTLELMTLREVIDDEGAWASEEQEEASDYAGCVRHMAKLISATLLPIPEGETLATTFEKWDCHGERTPEEKWTSEVVITDWKIIESEQGKDDASNVIISMMINPEDAKALAPLFRHRALKLTVEEGEG